MPAQQHLVQARQPRRAVLIRQRNAGVHLGLVRVGVIVVALGILPMLSGRQLGADRRLAARRHPHQHQNHPFAPPATLFNSFKTSSAFQSFVGYHCAIFPSGPITAVESECVMV